MKELPGKGEREEEGSGREKRRWGVAIRRRLTGGFLCAVHRLAVHRCSMVVYCGELMRGKECVDSFSVCIFCSLYFLNNKFIFIFDVERCLKAFESAACDSYSRLKSGPKAATVAVANIENSGALTGGVHGCGVGSKPKVGARRF